MEKAKLLKESISLKEIGSRAKYKVENCNGQNKMGGNTLIKANSTETYKCTARVNFTIKLGILKQPFGTYKGEFMRNKKHGKGEYMYNNFNTYKGEYRNGLKSGRGILYSRYE